MPRWRLLTAAELEAHYGHDPRVCAAVAFLAEGEGGGTIYDDEHFVLERDGKVRTPPTELPLAVLYAICIALEMAHAQGEGIAPGTAPVIEMGPR